MNRAGYHAARRLRGQTLRGLESRRAAHAHSDFSGQECRRLEEIARSVAGHVPAAFSPTQSLSNGRFATRRRRILDLIERRRWQRAKGFSIDEVNRELRRTFHCWREDVGPTRAPVPLPGEAVSPGNERR